MYCSSVCHFKSSQSQLLLQPLMWLPRPLWCYCIRYCIRSLHIPTCATRKSVGAKATVDHESVSPFAHGQYWDTFYKNPQKASQDEASPAGILSWFPSFVSILLSPTSVPWNHLPSKYPMCKPCLTLCFQRHPGWRGHFTQCLKPSCLCSWALCDQHATANIFFLKRKSPVSDGPDFFISCE